MNELHHYLLLFQCTCAMMYVVIYSLTVGMPTHILAQGVNFKTRLNSW